MARERGLEFGGGVDSAKPLHDRGGGLYDRALRRFDEIGERIDQDLGLFADVLGDAVRFAARARGEDSPPGRRRDDDSGSSPEGDRSDQTYSKTIHVIHAFKREA